MVDWKHFIAADGKAMLHTSVEISEIHQSFTARSLHSLGGDDQD